MARPNVYAATPTHLFTHTVDIQRPTFPVGTAGGRAPSYAAHLAAVPARVQPQPGSEFDDAGRQHSTIRATVFVGGGLDIKASDRLVWGVRKFDITGPPKDNQGAGVVVRLDCEEVTP